MSQGVKGTGSAKERRDRWWYANATGAYKSFVSMRKRCRNPNNKRFCHYGGRGITICARWAQFSNFLADMGERPEGMTLDRINNDGNYEPGNCRWATTRTQNGNQQKTVFVEYRGERISVMQAANRAGITYSTVWFRINKLGWPADRALSTPAASRVRRGL